MNDFERGFREEMEKISAAFHAGKRLRGVLRGRESMRQLTRSIRHGDPVAERYAKEELEYAKRLAKGSKTELPSAVQESIGRVKGQELKKYTDFLKEQRALQASK